MAGVEGNIGRGHNPVEAGGLGRVEGARRVIGAQGSMDKLPTPVTQVLPRAAVAEGSEIVTFRGKDARVYVMQSSTGSPELLASVREDVLGLHGRIFGPVYERNDPAQHDVLDDGPTHRRHMRGIHDVLAQRLAAHETHVVLLREGDQIVGSAIAYPAAHNERDTLGVEQDYPLEDYNAMQARTAFFDLGMIDEAHRGNGGWRPMADEMYGKLVDSGYRYVTAIVQQAEGFDQRSVAYVSTKGEILSDEEIVRPYDGNLRFLRVKLHNPNH